MITETSAISVGRIEVTVLRKPIKNLHLAVYPPDGRVRLAAPLTTSDGVIRAAVAKRLPWIRRQRRRFEQQARETLREIVSGESHWFLGRRYRLRVVESPGRPGVRLWGSTGLELCCRPGADRAARERVLLRWYRRHLHDAVEPLLAKWAPIIDVEPNEWRIRRMKTKWGSCNIEARRLWFNLELAKKPPRCIEYVVVHELVHLLEPRHNRRFLALMDRHLPRWRAVRRELGLAPLAYDSWGF